MTGEELERKGDPSNNALGGAPAGDVGGDGTGIDGFWSKRCIFTLSSKGSLVGLGGGRGPGAFRFCVLCFVFCVLCFVFCVFVFLCFCVFFSLRIIINLRGRFI